MRIALLTLTRGAVSGGYAKYLREIVPRLRAHSEVEELHVYVPPALANADPTWRTWTTVRSLRSEVAAQRPDVVFIPSAFHVDFGSIPVVTMIRNMEPLERPFAGNAPADAIRNAARAAMARRACRRSQRIIAVSNHVRDFLANRWKIDPASIGVVYHGVDVPPADFGGTTPVAALKDPPFLFTAGSIRPARGLEDLLGLPHAIAIGGAVDSGATRYAARLRRAFQHAGTRVNWLGRLTPAEMSSYFASAQLFIMTSRAEACPNTVLEAMAHGCLSVSTDQPPMPEFYGDTALFYRRGDRSDLARAVEEALRLNPSSAADLRERARLRAARFPWTATVEGTLRELRRVMR
jgi:glycosyltransferase involved in cell wall biosynthesis